MELGSPLVDPAAVLPRQECPTRERCGHRRLDQRPIEVAFRESMIGCGDGLVGRRDVDPAPRWQGQLVTAEGGRQRLRAVDATLVEEHPKLADEDRERLLPR